MAEILRTYLSSVCIACLGILPSIFRTQLESMNWPPPESECMIVGENLGLRRSALTLLCNWSKIKFWIRLEMSVYRIATHVAPMAG